MLMNGESKSTWAYHPSVQTGSLAAVGMLCVVALAGASCATRATSSGEIVFARSKGAGAPTSLYTIKLDGSGLRRLAKNSASPAVSPRNAAIAFQRNGVLWLMNRDGSGQRQLTHSPFAKQGGDDQPAWSPDGTRLYFSRITDRFQDRSIFSINSNGTGLRRIAFAPPTDHVDCYEHPAVSPVTPGVIAYDRTGDCEHGSGVTIAGVTQRGATATLPFRYPTSALGLDVYAPTWSPTGRLAYNVVDEDAAFSSPPRIGVAGVYVSTPDRSKPRRVARVMPSSARPSWSPDGAWIAYSIGRLYLVRADGTDNHPLVGAGQNVTDPAWLPAP
jgi:Tol biopolymer transport system component